MDPGLPAGVQVARGDLSDADSLEACLDGIDTVFLIWKQRTATNHGAALDVIAGHARRVVYVSSLTVDEDVDVQRLPTAAIHADIERRIQRAGLAWTFLRAAWLDSNAPQWAPDIRAGDVVRIPNARSGRAPIDPVDVGAVGVRVLTEPGHDGSTHILTGPERRTEGELVRIVGDVLGRSLKVEDVRREIARREMLEDGFDEGHADAILDHWSRLVTDPEPLTSTVAEITGTEPRTFRAWARDHLDAFR